MAGTWAGNYTHSETVQGCTFHNGGTLTAKLTTSAMGAISSSADGTGFEVRNLSGCTLVSTGSGSAPSSADMTSGATITGSWGFAVQGAQGTLPLPFSATFSGKTLTGTWTCTGCSGSFTLTKM